jgi:septal ring factor EnvC (AmiA/AmiB activator)
MTAQTSAIPAHLLEELSQLQKASQKEVQPPHSPGEVERSLVRIRNAAYFLRAKSDQVVELEQQLDLQQHENAKLLSVYNQAQTAIEELKTQMNEQITRADAAEDYARQLESQLKATELEVQETKTGLNRLIEVVEQTFGPLPGDFELQFGSDEKTAASRG